MTKLIQKYILDCDPGHDDAVAILFAAKYLNLIGITTSYGNSTISNTTKNALAICELANLSIPIAKGVSSPLHGEPLKAAYVMGETGFGGVTLPAPQTSYINIDAIDFIIEQAFKYQGEISIISTAPLTNIALALQKEPKLKEWINGISIMGGSTHIGNITPVAEFNTYSDPEALHQVLDSGIKTTMVGLDITTKIGLTNKHLEYIKLNGSKPAYSIAQALEFFLDNQKALFNKHIAPLHDVCAVIAFSHPELIEYKEVTVGVELNGKLTRGMTVYDYRDLNSDNKNSPLNSNNNDYKKTKVAVSACNEKIIQLVIDTLLSYP